eukprot:CAMPEP_0183333992 /NCGR_PEP_ID=MMETSP0164_2-20130417/2729_1 /TAXON_ID=221442 /ORGANISM="Coccolithus pelagicus ssp braarudi, Strain PLY182g" /LENGTH=131 /DNA_ID=CAMNT_0025503043 /DNA_START=228 /DNA_END=619 /DNA_ORIENTATION=+
MAPSHSSTPPTPARRAGPPADEPRGLGTSGFFAASRGRVRRRRLWRLDGQVSGGPGVWRARCLECRSTWRRCSGLDSTHRAVAQASSHDRSAGSRCSSRMLRASVFSEMRSRDARRCDLGMLGDAEILADA